MSNADDVSTKSLMAKIKALLPAIGFMVLLGYGFYYAFIRTTNEIGWLGADKSGRQILIQSLDAALQPDTEVTSEWDGSNILSRMLIGEPLRTTIRFKTTGSVEGNLLQNLHDHLEKPYSTLTDQFGEKISLRNDWERPKAEVIKSLDEHRAKTMEDLYSGYGFKKIELYRDGKLSASSEIRGTKNVKWAGSE